LIAPENHSEGRAQPPEPFRKRILAVHYSQSGQLTEIVESILGPLHAVEGIEVVSVRLAPLPPYPFPWPIGAFLDAFPESALMIPPALAPLPIDAGSRFDLVILAYTVWYLAPSPPVSAFLQSPAARVMKDTPVVTVVNARDKWLSAQELVKAHLARIGAVHTDHVALVHSGNALQNLVTTLRWMWTGRRNAFWGIFPPAGVDPAEIAGARRFGEAVRAALIEGRERKGRPMLEGLGAVSVNRALIPQEHAARAVFDFWARAVRRCGAPGERRRCLALAIFGVFLASLLVLSLPAVLIYKWLIAPLAKSSLDRAAAYYERPSGSARRPD